MKRTTWLTNEERAAQGLPPKGRHTRRARSTRKDVRTALSLPLRLRPLASQFGLERPGPLSIKGLTQAELVLLGFRPTPRKQPTRKPRKRPHRVWYILVSQASGLILAVLPDKPAAPPAGQTLISTYGPKPQVSTRWSKP